MCSVLFKDRIVGLSAIPLTAGGVLLDSSVFLHKQSTLLAGVECH